MQQKLALSADQRWIFQHAARCTNDGNDEMRRSTLSGLEGRVRVGRGDPGVARARGGKPTCDDKAWRVQHQAKAAVRS